MFQPQKLKIKRRKDFSFFKYQNFGALSIIFCKALSRKYLHDTIMFVTLEPCLMCASAISEVHIDKLYFGAYDNKNGGIENFKFQSKRNHAFKTEVYGGIMENDCKALIENFFKKLR